MTDNPCPKSTREGWNLDAKREEMLRQVSEDGPSCLSVFRKAYAGHSLRAAIDAFCLQCAWLDRDAIRQCRVTACPLWAVRPFTTKRSRQA